MIIFTYNLKQTNTMSQFIQHIKLALENTVLCRGGNSAKDSFDYATKMEHMLKRQLKQELTEILESGQIHKGLAVFINKIKPDEED